MVIGKLVCEHYVSYSSKWIDLLKSGEMCPECGVMKMVIVEWSDEWTVKCRECSYMTRHGYARKYADESAARHSAATGHSAYLVWYNHAPAPARAYVKASQSSQKLSDLFPENASPPF